MNSRENTVYAQPFFYEIAFSFRDIPKEVDVIEELIRRFSRVPVNRVLELACGPAPHAGEFLRRGYSYLGLDINPVMLDYARQKLANQAGHAGQAGFLQGDMIDFDLERPADFACTLLGSLYAHSTDEVFDHFRSIARALRSGGLYLLDWCVNFRPSGDSTDTWEIERDGIRVRTTYRTQLIDTVEQLVQETILLEVVEAGKSKSFLETVTRRMIHPQEFLLMIRSLGDFEFLGWWNNWNPDQLLDGAKPISRPIIVVRKR